MRWGPHVALASAVVAVLIASGAARLDPGHASDDGDFVAARTRMEVALSAIHERLQVPERSAAVAADSGALARASERRQIEERSAIILAQLDSLGRTGDRGWQGPMTGLRASLADLEHRTDLALLSELDAAGADSLFDFWLAELAHQLDVVDTAARDPLAIAAWHHEFKEVRAAHAVLAATRPTRAAPGADAAATRTRFARDLVLLRRRMRAFVRSADPLDTLPT